MRNELTLRLRSLDLPKENDMPIPITDHRMLTLDQAEDMALELMEKHGLIKAGWEFVWGNGKHRLGCAGRRMRRDPRAGYMYTVSCISISRHLVALNPASIVRDTILHEIAHALAGVEHGHDHVWKAVCRKIGAEPTRLAGEEVRVVQPRYAIRCLSCDQVVGRRHRRVSPSRLSNAHCGACGPQSTGQLRLVDLGESTPATASE